MNAFDGDLEIKYKKINFDLSIIRLYKTTVHIDVNNIFKFQVFQICQPYAAYISIVSVSNQFKHRIFNNLKLLKIATLLNFIKNGVANLLISYNFKYISFSK